MPRVPSQHHALVVAVLSFVAALLFLRAPPSARQEVPPQKASAVDGPRPGADAPPGLAPTERTPAAPSMAERARGFAEATEELAVRCAISLPTTCSERMCVELLDAPRDPLPVVTQMPWIAVTSFVTALGFPDPTGCQDAVQQHDAHYLDRCEEALRLDRGRRGNLVSCIAFGAALPDPDEVLAACNELAAEAFGVEGFFEGIRPKAHDGTGCSQDCTEGSPSYPCDEVTGP